MGGRRGSSKYPGSGVMSPVTVAAEITATGQHRTGADYQLHLKGHTSLKTIRDLGDHNSLSLFGSGSSGDSSGTSDRCSGLTQPAQQLVNIPEDSSQQHSQKQLHFSRFVPNEESTSGKMVPVDQLASSAIPPPPQFSFSNSTSHYPNHEARVASRHGPLIFREQTGARSTAGKIPGSHTSFRVSRPKPITNSHSQPTAQAADTVSPSSWSFSAPPSDHRYASSEGSTNIQPYTDRR
jgi:hypothetical protein